MALVHMNEYPSLSDPQPEHDIHFAAVIDTGDELKVSCGPHYDENDPGVQGLDWYGPETYFDFGRHIIPEEMQAALPPGYEDCIYCVGEYRMVEEEATVESPEFSY